MTVTTTLNRSGHWVAIASQGKIVSINISIDSKTAFVRAIHDCVERSFAAHRLCNEN